MSLAVKDTEKMTRENANKIIRLVESLDRVTSEDEELFELLCEKVNLYFEGRENLSETAEEICKIFD